MIVPLKDSLRSHRTGERGRRSTDARALSFELMKNVARARSLTHLDVVQTAAETEGEEGRDDGEAEGGVDAPHPLELERNAVADEVGRLLREDERRLHAG